MLAFALRYRAATALFFGSLILIHVLYEYFGGGITTHHLLARADMPGISNAWGILSVTLLSYLVLNRVASRPNRKDGQVILGFLGGAALGLVMALLWEFGVEAPLPYLLLVPLLLALFIPVYRGECLLGYVLAMAFTFGGVLPVLFGGILCLAAFLVYKVIRGGVLWLINRP
ncbi:hypothetical protein [Robiginitalea sediminis]|uniref:hypothetical protein n=1 Tax=Robiginitalea sediminis TaxID=1982593 RepID=UPI000B4ACBDB|nr:hypothetical protein [Robiginitalea sediminis]